MTRNWRVDCPTEIFARWGTFFPDPCFIDFFDSSGLELYVTLESVHCHYILMIR